MTSRKRLAPATVVAALGLLLAACGSNSATDSTPGSATGSGSATPGGTSGTAQAGQTELTVGSTPALANASLYLASSDGTFAQHQLKVTTKTVTSGQQAIPLLLNGQIQFSAADSLGAITAIAHHAPLVFVAQASYAPTDPAKDTTGLLVTGNSPIKDAAGLNGKTVAVNAVGGIAQLAAKASIDLAGGDASTVKFVELPFPQMVAAIQAGRVDAGVEAEPFVTQGKATGLRDVLAVTSKAMPGVPTVVYVTSKAYAAKNPAVVAAFAASVNAANTELAGRPEQVRTIGATSTTVGADILAKIVLPVFSDKPLAVDTLNSLQSLMVKYKLLPAPVDLSQSIFATTS